MVTLPKKRTPCYGCEERNANCHSICEKYKAYKVEQQIEKGIREQIEKVNREKGEYLQALKEKRRKRKRK